MKIIRVLRYCGVLISILILIYIFWNAYPVMLTIMKNHDLTYIQVYIHSFSWYGVCVLFLLHAIQPIVAFIPALAIQLATGAAYGAGWGTLLGAAGFLTGNIIMFRLLQYGAHTLSFSSRIHKEMMKFQGYLQTKNKTLYMFLLFLVPIAPNWLKPYLGVFAGFSFPVYITLACTGCILPIWIGTAAGEILLRPTDALFVSAAVVCVVLTLVSVYLYRLKQNNL